MPIRKSNGQMARFGLVRLQPREPVRIPAAVRFGHPVTATNYHRLCGIYIPIFVSYTRRMSLCYSRVTIISFVIERPPYDVTEIMSRKHSERTFDRRSAMM